MSEVLLLAEERRHQLTDGVIVDYTEEGTMFSGWNVDMTIEIV